MECPSQTFNFRRRVRPGPTPPPPPPRLLLLLTVMMLQANSVLSGSCDYVSTASGPCDGTATEGSCADYYQIFASLSYQYIQSPNYPGYYADNQACRWVISACNCYDPMRPDAQFHVEVEMLDYDMQDSPSCTQDYVEIKDGKRLWGRSFSQYCGNACVNGNSNNLTYSSDLHLLLTFQTDVYNPNQPQQYRGFQARYRCFEYGDYTSKASAPCDSTASAGSCADYFQLFATTTEQYIKSPNYPGYYPNNIVCRWVLSACGCAADSSNPNIEYRVEFEVLDYEIQDSPSCQRDFLEIKDGKRLWDHRFAQKCGNTCASGDSNITRSSAKHLLVSFQTDVFDEKDPTPHRGFLAKYRCVAVPILQSDDLVLGPANYLLIAFSVLLAIFFGCASVLLFIREKQRSETCR